MSKQVYYHSLLRGSLLLWEVLYLCRRLVEHFLFLNDDISNFLDIMDSNRISTMYKKIKENGPTIWAIDVEGSTEILIGDQYKLELSAFDSLNYFGESVVVCSLAASAVVGSYYKSAIYQYMYRTMKDNGPTPIDLLILVNTITQHLVCLILVATYTIGLTLDITFSHYLGQAWCNVPWYAGNIWRRL